MGDDIYIYTYSAQYIQTCIHIYMLVTYIKLYTYITYA